MALATTHSGSIEVCIDCTATACNGRDSVESTPDCEPWALYADTPPELMPTADFGYVDDGEEEPDDMPGTTDFSTAPCEACGSTLAGSRYTFATWEVAA